MPATALVNKNRSSLVLQGALYSLVVKAEEEMSPSRSVVYNFIYHISCCSMTAASIKEVSG